MDKYVEVGSERGLRLTMAGQESRQKYAYFLLGAAGAAIGFAVTQTKEATFHWSLIFLSLALVCWSLSFFAGCRFLHHIALMQLINSRTYRISSGIDPEAGSDKGKQLRLVEKIRREEFAPTEKKSELYLAVQPNAFLAGALFFLVWHGLSIWLRTPDVSPLWPVWVYNFLADA